MIRSRDLQNELVGARHNVSAIVDERRGKIARWVLQKADQKANQIIHNATQQLRQNFSLEAGGAVNINITKYQFDRSLVNAEKDHALKKIHESAKNATKRIMTVYGSWAMNEFLCFWAVTAYEHKVVSRRVSTSMARPPRTTHNVELSHIFYQRCM